MKQLILIGLVLFSFKSQTNAAIRYVTPNGAGALNGTSWANAYPGTSLQLAIDASGAGDEVWVALGTYYPTSGTDRTSSFSMKNNVAIYGSFAGTETLLSQRVLTSGLTSILSGEIGVVGISDNCYHVLSNSGLDNTALIDGFIIRDANDDRPAGLDVGLGGGFYNDGSGGSGTCNPTIRNCVIRNNQAVFGAGIFNNGYDSGNASPQIINCVITDNFATTGGGGIDNFGLLNGNASPTLLNCVVYNNSAAQRAGGMYCWGGNNGSASPVMVNTCFVNNNAVDGGGVVADRLNSSAGSSGNSSPELRNCIFWGNTASGVGPQFFLLGGASFNPTYSNIDLTNQTAPHILSGTGTGNIQLSPLFRNILSGVGPDGEWMTADDGLQLQSSSPCIDAGDAFGTTAMDILSENRIQYSAVDMGAYEFDSTSLLAVFENTQSTLDLLLSPNPSNSSVKLIYELQETRQVYVALLDLNGKLLWSTDQGKQIKGEYQLQVDLSSFQNGIYLLNFETSDQRLIQRVVKTD
ncbi:MAG: hypothetical protein K0S23_368 [Fluviicola sp.]|jgi:hypothetical protein|uniref:T9SS type A sorting domain-containing protein n=1 Tax=Fluviicola sp. TaxID=1917219 RepID=UPI00262550F8|nr:T9SS type A sorting domain-containing protein [Fluviicola sp.]MDF3026061.1 hypothetical protein [Fluviicola sp.]